MCSVVGYIFSLIAAVLTVSGFEDRAPYGSTVIVYIIDQSLNFIGLMSTSDLAFLMRPVPSFLTKGSYSAILAFFSGSNNGKTMRSTESSKFGTTSLPSVSAHKSFSSTVEKSSSSGKSSKSSSGAV